MIKTRTWIIIFALILILSAIAVIFVQLNAPMGKTARILVGGECVQEIDLSAVSEPYSFTLESASGSSNTVSVENGRICVSSAECPDKVCVHKGWISDGSEPIVCLPNRLVIEITGDSGFDGVSQ